MPYLLPYAVINAGPKCIGLDLDRIALDYHPSETSDSHRELKCQLELLCDIWALFEDVKEAAKAWEEKEKDERRKRKRKHDEDDMDVFADNQTYHTITNTLCEWSS